MKKLMVALVTPFTRDNKVDYKSMDRILHRLLKEGCDRLHRVRDNGRNTDTLS